MTLFAAPVGMSWFLRVFAIDHVMEHTATARLMPGLCRAFEVPAKTVRKGRIFRRKSLVKQRIFPYSATTVRVLADRYLHRPAQKMTPSSPLTRKNNDTFFHRSKSRLAAKTPLRQRTTKCSVSSARRAPPFAPLERNLPERRMLGRPAKTTEKAALPGQKRTPYKI